jgi:hypothetical protein
MKKNIITEFYFKHISKDWDIPKNISFNRLEKIIEYSTWLEKNNLKANTNGYPNNFKKKKTKPRGRNPLIMKRNKQILTEYYKLTEKNGLKSTVAREQLAKKFNLRPSSIQTICKKG